MKKNYIIFNFLEMTESIFTLPNIKIPKWVDTNDARTNLSEIKVTDDHCIVPNHIYYDCLVEDDFLDDLVAFEDNFVLYPKRALEYIQKVRSNSYRACLWYPVIAGKIPTSPSILECVPSIEELSKNIKKYVTIYPFVRLCTMSPKDVNPTPIYNVYDFNKAITDIKNSQRTCNLFTTTKCYDCNGVHLFMRQLRNYEWEARCFWSRDKLTAVSMPLDGLSESDKISIVNFFNTHRKDMPYHSAVVDIGKISSDNNTTENDIELIEFNTFGPDMNATAGNFSWYEDVMTLVFSPTPVFR